MWDASAINIQITFFGDSSAAAKNSADRKGHMHTRATAHTRHGAWLLNNETIVDNDKTGTDNGIKLVYL